MDLIKKLRTGASKAADVAQQTVEIARLTATIAGKKKDIEKYMLLIGQEVYEAMEAGDLTLARPKATELGGVVQTLKSESAELELQIRRIRHESACACGEPIAQEAKFCPACGRPQLRRPSDVISIKAEPSREREPAESPEPRETPPGPNEPA
ncbi:zinc ribbon domain-containing protein [Paenibacillus sp. TRM 82003]|nr:zinc ribbon domain-containing protein [Paenibacillus sp. TRM 82003]